MVGWVLMGRHCLAAAVSQEDDGPEEPGKGVEWGSQAEGESYLRTSIFIQTSVVAGFIDCDSS